MLNPSLKDLNPSSIELEEITELLAQKEVLRVKKLEETQVSPKH